jgi:hypothetical protein
MKARLLFLLLFTSLSSFAQQYTAIPDANFEKKLIALGIDDVEDKQVLTSKINAISSLDVSSSSITDLTGIQDFINLTSLKCGGNQLTNLDVSFNGALDQLFCSFNNLISLNVSKNTELKILECSANQLTDLDISKNIYLNELYCGANQLSSLDVSKNTALKKLACSYNRLTNLNLKNGNNSILNTLEELDDFFNFKNNPNLTCIQVDDENYSNANWATIKDDTAVYSTDCSILGTESHDFNEIAIYPIPTNGVLHIDNIVIEEASIYNALGSLVKKITFSSNPKNTLDLSAISSGIYHMNLKTKDGVVIKKIVIE